MLAPQAPGRAAGEGLRVGSAGLWGQRAGAASALLWA